MKTDIKSMTLPELEDYFRSLGEKAFRAAQVFGWMQKGVCDFSEMTDLSKTLRETLTENAFLECLETITVQKSSKEDTRKYLFGIRGGSAVESVFMKYRHGNTVCISSQAGCRMGCTFCASGANGLLRDLTAAEMIDQVLAIAKDTGERIGNVVVMGTGEPFENYRNLSRFLEIIHSPKGLNMSYRSITVSTCGLLPKMELFGHDYPQVNLAVSLHAPNDRIRDQIMPINRSYPIKDLIEASRSHAEKTGRRVTFEYALIKGVNDRDAHAEELAERLKHMLCHVNLIPLNPVPELGLSGADRKAAERFLSILEKKHIQATIRREMGTEIDGACGQLRLQTNR